MLLEVYNLKVNHKRVLKLMRELDIASIVRKKYKALKGRENIKKNILNRQLYASEPLKKLVTDITYIPTREKMIYLCTIIDLYNNEPLAWVVSDNQDKSLSINTVNKLAKEYDLNQALLHSDQGVHYRSHDYVELLEELDITQSMSRRGNCWDNAKAESFFSHFKCDKIKPLKRKLKNLSEVKELVDEYMNYYINIRPQRGLGGVSPRKYKTLQLGA